MATNPQLLKRRIKTAKNIAQISKAMEMISASKIKKAQNKVLNNKPYAQKIVTLTSSLLHNTDKSSLSNPFLRIPDMEKKSLIIIISPDKGLCGSLNTYITKKILELSVPNTKIVAVGKKAEQFCIRMGFEVLGVFPMGSSIPSYNHVYNIIQIIQKEYNENNISSVKLLYARFNSVFSQEVHVADLLPIPVAQIESVPEYLYEPNMHDIISDLLPYYIEVQLYHSILEAHTSEQAARIVSMQNAKNNALDIADALTLSYNKSRQERITNEILGLANNI